MSGPEVGSPCPRAGSTPSLSSMVCCVKDDGRTRPPCCPACVGGPDRCVLQVLRGCEDSELQELHLQRNPALYNFTRQGAGLSVSGAGLRGRVLVVTASAGPRVEGLLWP